MERTLWLMLGVNEVKWKANDALNVDAAAQRLAPRQLSKYRSRKRGTPSSCDAASSERGGSPNGSVDRNRHRNAVAFCRRS